MRIAYVEDNAMNLALVQRIAMMSGHIITSFTEGEIALAELMRQPFDLILMDVELAGEMSGLQVVRSLRAQGLTTPIVAVTAYAMMGDREKTLEAGCNDYLPKPLPISDFLTLLARYEGQMRASQAAPAVAAISSPAASAPAIPAPLATAASPTPPAVVTPTATPPSTSAPIPPIVSAPVETPAQPFPAAPSTPIPPIVSAPVEAPAQSLPAAPSTPIPPTVSTPVETPVVPAVVNADVKNGGSVPGSSRAGNTKPLPPESPLQTIEPNDGPQKVPPVTPDPARPASS